MSASRALVPGLRLRGPLRTCAEAGHARVTDTVSRDVLEALSVEVGAGPFRMFGESFGAVRQQIDGYDVRVPSEGFPLLTRLARELREHVRSHGRGIRGLVTWAPNEVGVAHYVPGSIGITPHLDGKWYRRLIVVVTVFGRAPFAICASRDPEDVVDRWTAEPGDLVLMRGPGLAGARDGRPFHLVEGPRDGERLSLGVRMSVKPPA
jgi:hypothetical protein